MSRRQVIPSLSTALKQWTNLCDKPPTGFEKYFDKGKKNQEQKSDSSTSKSNAFDKAFKKRINRMSQGLVFSYFYFRYFDNYILILF